jgi:hypothetical protein
VQFGQPKKLAIMALVGTGLRLVLGWLLGRKADKS